MPCARAHGARCLLVATGQYALALSELARLGAEAVVADFSDGPRVKSALGLTGTEAWRVIPGGSAALELSLEQVIPNISFAHSHDVTGAIHGREGQPHGRLAW